MGLGSRGFYPILVLLTSLAQDFGPASFEGVSLSNRASPPRWLPAALLLILGSLWGLSFSLSKLAISNGVHPLGYALWQSAGPCVILLGVCLLRRRPPDLGRRSLRYYLLAGLLGIAIPNANFAFALQHVPAGILSIVVTLAPLLTYVLATLAGLERPTARRLAGLALGLAGALLLVLPKAALPSAQVTFWVAVSFVTPVFYSMNTVYAAKARPPDSDSVALACGMMGAAALWQLPVALSADALYGLQYPPGVADWALLAQVTLSCFAHALFFELLRLAGPVTLSQVAYIVTLMGITWGWLIFDERHSPWIWLATGLIFAGVALVNWQGRRRP